MMQQHSAFVETVWDYYRAHGRHDMAWREHPTPYNVLVSEVMLQQTQVARAKVKFAEFMQAFPTISALADAPLADVLVVWSGLGYNRRAKYLHLAARAIRDDHNSTVPASREALVGLPGVGPNTAGAICAYAYNQPVAFVETNIRSVYLHHFFSEQLDTVHDKEIIELVMATVDTENPREWYWALMDYGTWLKSQGLGRLAMSKQHKKQSPLAGSLREMRGRILKQLVIGGLEDTALRLAVSADERYDRALEDLQKEGLAELRESTWCLTGSVEPS